MSPPRRDPLLDWFPYELVLAVVALFIICLFATISSASAAIQSGFAPTALTFTPTPPTWH